MRKINLKSVFTAFFWLLTSLITFAYAQQVINFSSNLTWQIVEGSINKGEKYIAVRKDLHEDTLWKRVEFDFKLSDQTLPKYGFGFVLNATDSLKYGLIRFYRNNNQIHLQVGFWEYNKFRTFLNTPIGDVFNSGGLYKAVIEPNVDRKDWRPWLLKVIDVANNKLVLEKTLVNTMPLLGMGKTGIYSEGKNIEFIDYKVTVLPKENVLNELKLAPLFKSGVVLQRNKKITIWGYATAASDVEVSLLNTKATTKSDLDGKWQVQIGPFDATESTELIVKNGLSEIKISNVAIGEVWLASGQSNMEMRIYQSDIRDDLEQDANLRVFMQPMWPSENPQFDTGGEWIGTRHPQFDVSSAAAYSFAKELRKTLNVPVGIICTYWGGTGAEAWLPKHILANNATTKPILDDYIKAKEDFKAGNNTTINPWFVPGQNRAPGALFNGMVNPHIPYTISGVIWYQGESNANRAMQYHYLFPMLIESWRKEWNSPELPFYFVQLVNYDGGQSGAEIPNAWPAIREAQRLTLQKVKHAGMAIALELGNPSNIHPFYKKEVGKRLARLALYNVYGYKEIVRSGPLLKSIQIENQSIVLHFDEVAKGLISKDKNPLRGFILASDDQKFVEANASIDKDGKRIIVTSEKIKNPKAVRYAWANNPEEANLINSEGLPASPFRTDDWALFN